MDMKNVTGAITALVTPFDAQGNVDFEALEHFCRLPDSAGN